MYVRLWCIFQKLTLKTHPYRLSSVTFTPFSHSLPLNLLYFLHLLFSFPIYLYIINPWSPQLQYTNISIKKLTYGFFFFFFFDSQKPFRGYRAFASHGNPFLHGGSTPDCYYNHNRHGSCREDSTRDQAAPDPHGLLVPRSGFQFLPQRKHCPTFWSVAKAQCGGRILTGELMVVQTISVDRVSKYIRS